MKSCKLYGTTIRDDVSGGALLNYPTPSFSTPRHPASGTVPRDADDEFGPSYIGNALTAEREVNRRRSMSRRPARFTQGEVARAIRAAKAAGASSIRIKPDGTIIVDLVKYKEERGIDETVEPEEHFVL